ncbi:response regulator [Kitasatospora sp. NPDC058170]|uniref:response regulator n=1 Tax=Kitasatospora sp. NPDC058170 TaxID=3346364 RepID=UPI0036DD1D8E
MIRVVVVDDEALIRSGFSLLLNASADIEVVAAVAGGQALDAVAAHTPDLVLLDIRMPDIDGLMVLGHLMQLPQRPVVAMLTTFDSDEYIVQALRSGASGYLLKDTDPDDLARQVRSLYGGAAVLAQKVVAAVIDGYLSHHRELAAAAAHTARLNEREHDVLLLIAEGLSNGEIGRRLHLSEGTVKGHVSVVLAKLAVDNRVQAALWAQRAGLLAESGAR